MSDFSAGDYSRTRLLPLTAIVVAKCLALLMKRGLLIFSVVFSGCASVPVTADSAAVESVDDSFDEESDAVGSRRRRYARWG